MVTARSEPVSARSFQGRLRYALNINACFPVSANISKRSQKQITFPRGNWVERVIVATDWNSPQVSLETRKHERKLSKTGRRWRRVCTLCIATARHVNYNNSLSNNFFPLSPVPVFAMFIIFAQVFRKHRGPGGEKDRVEAWEAEITR